MRLKIRQLGQRGAERAELGDGIGAANAGGDVLGQSRIGGRLGVARGQRRESLVVGVVRNQHAFGPDVLIG